MKCSQPENKMQGMWNKNPDFIYSRTGNTSSFIHSLILSLSGILLIIGNREMNKTVHCLKVHPVYWWRQYCLSSWSLWHELEWLTQSLRSSVPSLIKKDKISHITRFQWFLEKGCIRCWKKLSLNKVVVMKVVYGGSWSYKSNLHTQKRIRGNNKGYLTGICDIRFLY